MLRAHKDTIKENILCYFIDTIIGGYNNDLAQVEQAILAMLRGDYQNTDITQIRDETKRNLIDTLKSNGNHIIQYTQREGRRTFGNLAATEEDYRRGYCEVLVELLKERFSKQKVTLEPQQLANSIPAYSLLRAVVNHQHVDNSPFGFVPYRLSPKVKFGIYAAVIIIAVGVTIATLAVSGGMIGPLFLPAYLFGFSPFLMPLIASIATNITASVIIGVIVGVFINALATIAGNTIRQFNFNREQRALAVSPVSESSPLLGSINNHSEDNDEIPVKVYYENDKPPLTMSAPRSMFVSAFKELYEQKQGLPAQRQRLLFAGRELSNNCTLADYHVQENSALRVVAKPRPYTA